MLIKFFSSRQGLQNLGRVKVGTIGCGGFAGACNFRTFEIVCRVYYLAELSTADMASDGSGPAPGVGQMNIKKVTVALCFALMLMNDGVGAGANDAKPTFMHLPMRLRNPRGVGLSHQRARTSNLVHLPELHNQRETEESDSVPEDHGNTIQDDNARSRFAHLPQHIHDPRGAHVSRPMEEVNVDPISANQVESATPEVNQVRYSHLPRLHNPRGVNVVKQIQERMNEESGRQAGEEGDKS